jgi:hypothetical protein
VSGESDLSAPSPQKADVGDLVVYHDDGKRAGWRVGVAFQVDEHGDVMTAKAFGRKRWIPIGFCPVYVVPAAELSIAPAMIVAKIGRQRWQDIHMARAAVTAVLEQAVAA